MKLAPYARWSPDTPAPDPRTASAAEVEETLAAIVEAEGPMVAALAIRRYISAVEGLTRAGGSTRARLHEALASLAEGARILLVAELGDEDREALIAAAPNARVIARARDDRSLAEVPLSELADGFLLVRRKRGVSRYTESVQRALLHALELKRLTGTTAARLLAAWHASQRWIDEEGPAHAHARLDPRPLPDALTGAARQPADELAAPDSSLPAWQAAMSSGGPTTVRTNPPMRDDT